MLYGTSCQQLSWRNTPPSARDEQVSVGSLLTAPACPVFLQSQWQPQLQQLRDMGIQDDELSLRALQATGGDIQAALELIFAGGAP